MCVSTLMNVILAAQTRARPDTAAATRLAGMNVLTLTNVGCMKKYVAKGSNV